MPRAQPAQIESRRVRTTQSYVVGLSREGMTSLRGEQIGVAENIGEHLVENLGATTTFVDDSSTNVFKGTQSVHDVMNTTKSDISDFLERPVLLTTGLWNTSATASTDLFSWDSNLVWSLTGWADKLKGFRFHRGILGFRLVMNANPFQAGKLMLNFLPMDELLGFSTAVIPMHRAYLASKTMLPSVVIDCREGAGVIELPYVNTSNWHDSSDTNTDWGKIYLTVLSPMVTGSGGEVDVQYSLYVYLKDVILAGPILPQGPKSGKKFKAKTYSKDEPVEKSGPISDALHLTAKVADSLSDVPVLSSYAKDASWVANGLAGLASWFGWSKPSNLPNVDVVHRSLDLYSGNCDGASTAYPLSLMSDNKIKVRDDLSLVDCDEMSFDYLKTKSCLIDVISWSASSATDTVLSTRSAQPWDLSYPVTKTVNGINYNLRIGPPAFYLSRQFLQWRGTLRYKFCIVKTGFHTGRLQLTYTPLNTSTLPTTTTSIYSYREIIDIRDGDEFTIDIPFIYPLSYAENNTGYTPGGDVGKWQLRVLNELRAPETAAQTIQILVYGSACSDFELAMPNAGNPIANLAFSPEMDIGDFSANDNVSIVNEAIASTHIDPVQLNTRQMHFGESFNSIKQLLTRFNQINYNAVITPASSNCISIFPWAIGRYRCNGTTGAAETTTLGGDMFTFLSGMFLMYRGGMRIKLFQSTLANQPTVLTLGVVNYSANATLPISVASIEYGKTGAINWSSTASTLQNNGPIATTDFSTGVAIARVPWQSRRNASITFPIDPTNNYAIVIQSCFNRLLVNGNGNLSPPIALYRACDDDFHFSYYIGCPPILVSVT